EKPRPFVPNQPLKQKTSAAAESSRHGTSRGRGGAGTPLPFRRGWELVPLRPGCTPLSLGRRWTPLLRGPAPPPRGDTSPPLAGRAPWERCPPSRCQVLGHIP